MAEDRAPQPAAEKKSDDVSLTVVPVAAEGYGGLAATGTF